MSRWTVVEKNRRVSTKTEKWNKQIEKLSVCVSACLCLCLSVCEIREERERLSVSCPDGRESRVLAWEAKEKKAKAQAKGVEEKKPVDLEKEWARTAAAKQVKLYITFSNGNMPKHSTLAPEY
jgi:hypothetical protein